MSAGIGKFTNNTEMNIADSPYGITLAIGHIPQYIRGMQYKEYLTGGSASLNMSILGIYAGTAFSGELEDLNISLDTGVNSSFDNSISLGISNADYVGNIFNSNIFSNTYEYNQHIKNYIAVENLDGVNFYCDENGTIRLQKGEQLYAADTGRWENVRGVYKLINGWRQLSLEEIKKCLMRIIEMNNKGMYIICICGCLIIKLFCNLFWYLEPRETMIKLHSDNLKEIMAINPISESKVLDFSLPSKGNFIGFDFLFVDIGNRESTYKYYQNALKDRGWKADKINGGILILKNKMKKGVIMYVDNSKDDIIHYGITNDWEEKSVKTKIEFQNTYKKNIVKRWSKILK